MPCCKPWPSAVNVKLRLCALLSWLILGMLLPASAAQRVISLAPSTTELAYAAGMGNTLLAVSAYSDYPPAAKQLEQVASWQGINLERILALKPDLVLAWRGGNPQRVLDQLASFGIPIFMQMPKILTRSPNLWMRWRNTALIRNRHIRPQPASANR